jgi:signal transduction histidine kinase
MMPWCWLFAIQEGTMNKPADDLSRRYLAALRAYLAKGGEAALERAYEMGREAVSDSCGIMDLAKAHEQALLQVLSESPGDILETCRQMSLFFVETLWSFEMMQRGFREANRLSQELNGLLESRARQLTAANSKLKLEIAERKRIETALRRSEENLRRLSRQILVAQEEERKRISRELHDEVGQALTAINVNLAMFRQSTGTHELAGKIADLQRLLEQTMETVHAFTRELRPAMLDHLGVIPALRAYVRNFGERTGLRIDFRAAPEVEQLGMEEKTVIYRVTQEGLTNIAKHAHASKAAVLIDKAEEDIRMEVRDNGKAVQVAEAVFGARGKRLGLLGIQERVRLVNGDFKLESTPGKGTVLRVRIPFKVAGAKAN